MISITDCLKDLNEAQDTEEDNREMAREADLFLNKRDGQWEPTILSKLSNRPKYTFDECNPIVDDIMGEMAAAEFNIKVSPASGDASKTVARIYEGLFRNIENISKANFIYTAAARTAVSTGFGAWRVVADFKDEDSFQQDLLIKSIPDAINCVWFDPNATTPDASDAKFGWVLTSLTKAVYDEEYPDGSGMSVSRGLKSESFMFKKPGEIIIGEYLYLKEETRELALLSDSTVVVIDKEFEKIRDELLAQNIKVLKTRKRKAYIVHQRLFDGKDWLNDSKGTVFSTLPLVPVYGNFNISENKITYRGAIEKLMDAQRVLNYSESRKIEEGALAPKGKVWLTTDQAKTPKVKRGLETLNTNNDPVQFYDGVEGQPLPTYIGAPPSNPGLTETTATAQNFIQRSSGTFDEARGTAPPRRSGIAIKHLQNKSDNPKQKWNSMMEIALSRTYDLLLKAAPKVYSTQQMIRIIGQDGKTDYSVINRRVKDAETGAIITLNDLSQGKYDTVCDSGPAYKSQQDESVSVILELAGLDPSILEIGSDVLLNNINSPGIELIAERKRLQMVIQGVIPQSQMTEEELKLWQQIQEANKDKMSPTDQANIMIAKAQADETKGKNLERAAKAENEAKKIELKARELEYRRMNDMIKALNDQLQTQATALKQIREAIGVETLVDKTAVEAFHNQAMDLNRAILNS